MCNVIKISRPRVVVGGGRARVTSCVVDDDGVSRDLWFEVDEEYKDYLCEERSDAFVFGLLNLAQRSGCDIQSEAPMSAELHYRLTSALIPVLHKGGRTMYATKIIADLVDDPLPNAAAVGTGCSCGIDSIHVLNGHIDHPIKNLRLTHLVLNNAGAFRDESGQYDRSAASASRVAKENGLKAVITNSNISEFYSEQFEKYHTYANMFCVLALRKLWGSFFYGSSGHDVSKFRVLDNEHYDCSYYDILSLSCISTDGLVVYSEGAAKSRYEKTQEIFNSELAKKYLNVCQSDIGRNCSTCEKCRRTLLALDAIGGVESFSGVFDLETYHKNRTRFIGWALWRKWLGVGDLTNDAIAVLLPQCRIMAYVWALVYLLYRGIKA